VSEHVRRRNLERFRVAPTRARTIYMGIDAERYRPAAEPRENTGPLRILAAAMLAPWKAVDVLIRAFAALEDIPAQLLIAGDGPDAESLRTLAASLGVGSRVSFAGLRDDIDVLMREADVFVQPSYREALGLSLVEAMASGCAVIGSDVGGIPEVIDNEVTGLVVPAGDVQALAAALRRLASDDELRRRFGERGRARVLERFTLASAVEQHVAWCEELGEAALRQ
jgi:glycosyltransferase involved in cell wall biosynthesis